MKLIQWGHLATALHGNLIKEEESEVLINIPMAEITVRVVNLAGIRVEVLGAKASGFVDVVKNDSEKLILAEIIQMVYKSKIKSTEIPDQLFAWSFNCNYAYLKMFLESL